MEVPEPHSPVLRSRIVASSVPVLAIILATVLRMALAPIVGAAIPFVSYFLAILLLAWYSGFWAATVGILLSTITGTYFFISPATSSPFLVVSRADRATVFGFVFVSLAAAFALDLQRKTLARVQREVVRRRFAEDAEKRQRQ